jgi:hypothetical protein
VDNNMLVPLPFSGNVEDFKIREDLHVGYKWINTLSTNKKIHLSLFQRWPEHTLPLNYDIYIVSFHLEAVAIEWLAEQSKQINGEIIVLFDGTSNNYTLPKVRFLSYYYWHIQLDTMMQWFGTEGVPKNITHTASTFCNRITSTKLTVFTALAEYIGVDDCMLVLHDWLQKENIMQKDAHASASLKQLHTIFFDKYYGNKYTVDDFTNDLNFQQHTANPWQPSYQNCAIHFTNESFDISDIQDIALYSHPGPFITEKTLKCLLGKTAFIPTGQFDTYGALERLGFKFNYGLDLSFDNMRYDNDRLNSVVLLIKELVLMSKEEIYATTKESSDHNFEYIVSGDFYKFCEKINQHTVEQVIEHIDLVTN